MSAAACLALCLCSEGPARLWRARQNYGPRQRHRGCTHPRLRLRLSSLPPQGELPLSAIRINLEEKGKQIRSFLIEGGWRPGLGGQARASRVPQLFSGALRGASVARPPHGVCVLGRLINTIRVLCASYEDYSHWLLCLQTVSHGDGAPPPPGPESFPGLRVSTQVRGQQGQTLQPPLRFWAEGGGVGRERGPAVCLTSPLPAPWCPGPGWWPRLTLLRWTNQLGLRVPSTPVHAHQPLSP